jgi:hypothetical protein
MSPTWIQRITSTLSTADQTVTESDRNEHDPAQHRRDQQQAGGDELARPMADLAAEQAGHKRPDEGQENNRLNDHSGALSPSSD